MRWNDPERGLDRLRTSSCRWPSAAASSVRSPMSCCRRRSPRAPAGNRQLPGVGIAVNVSVKNLTDDALLERVWFLLRRYNLAPQLLTLEITESSVMSDPARMLAVLQRPARSRRAALDRRLRHRLLQPVLPAAACRCRRSRSTAASSTDISRDRDNDGHRAVDHRACDRAAAVASSPRVSRPAPIGNCCASSTARRAGFPHRRSDADRRPGRLARDVGRPVLGASAG